MTGSMAAIASVGRHGADPPPIIYCLASAAAHAWTG